MDFQAFRAAVGSWMNTSAACPVQWVSQTAVAPSTLPHVTLYIRRIDRAGKDTVTADAGPDEVRIAGARVVSVVCTAYGLAAGALERLATALDDLSRPTVLEPLQAAGLGVMDDGGIDVDLTEDRARMEVRFAVGSEVLDRPGEIRQAIVVVEVRREDGSPAISEQYLLGV